MVARGCVRNPCRRELVDGFIRQRGLFCEGDESEMIWCNAMPFLETLLMPTRRGWCLLSWGPAGNGESYCWDPSGGEAPAGEHLEGAVDRRPKISPPPGSTTDFAIRTCFLLMRASLGSMIAQV